MRAIELQREKMKREVVCVAMVYFLSGMFAGIYVSGLQGGRSVKRPKAGVRYLLQQKYGYTSPDGVPGAERKTIEVADI